MLLAAGIEFDPLTKSANLRLRILSDDVDRDAECPCPAVVKGVVCCCEAGRTV